MNTEKILPCLEKLNEVDQKMAALEADRIKIRAEILELLKVQNLHDVTLAGPGGNYRLTWKKNVAVEYDEILLKKRLQDRFHLILEPDARKLRLHRELARKYLLPILETVGSVSKIQVKECVRSGTLDKSVFAGAFRKTEKEILFVSRPHLNIASKDAIFGNSEIRISKSE